MAIIELLEHPDWEGALRRSFTTAITLLQTGRFRLSSSAVDDMRSWLTRGGAPHALNQLRRQMEQWRLPQERQDAVMAAMRQLVDEHRRPLLDLMADGVIPASRESVLHACGISEAQFAEVWGAAQHGNLPWEAALRAQGIPEERIAGLRLAIDRWLAEQGLHSPDRDWLN